jgi:hypothetical protein
VWPPGAWAAEHRAFAVGLVSVLPLLVWWLGWFPGFVSGDSVDQLGQVARGRFTNQHPAFHTMVMWLLTRLWDHAGMVTLAQVLAMAAVLAVAARRLAQLGVPAWLAGGSAVAVAALPAVGTTTIALWKDVPFTIALLWALTELLGLAADPSGWERRGPPLRLGAALALVWLFRHNGFITVVLLGAALAWLLRHRRRALALVAAPLVAGVAAVNLVLFPLVGVERASIQPASVFIGDVAASFVHNPSRFGADDTAYLSAVAPPEVWRRLYDCRDTTPLVFSDEFARGVILRDAARFRSIVVRTYLRDPLTVAGHRWCVASFLFVPPQPSGAYFHRPPFDVHPNDLGIERRPISPRAFAATFRVFQWAEPDGRLWLTWRPALALWAAAAAVGLLARRRALTGLVPVLVLVGAHVVNVVATSPAQEFRFGFPVYVMCLLLVPVAWRGRRTPRTRRAADE